MKSMNGKHPLEGSILTAMEHGENKIFMQLLIRMKNEGDGDEILPILQKHWSKRQQQKYREAYREKIGTR